ncbi:asparagine-linked glycosylation protein [Yamadazyma tenuis]|uniref:GDP-Man:Man(3)GlcNAc(2)-PP-Dol alpha-1,2-mannosyltransferase n=1 Tax=Candida tenuis (strain ATCC 10573 / BCRC 21748 / CBS 615 / JCM 9827 / NBRC 10315 / NRRL Y-1498 / VKM Y-70) TaxID=590646 RepID=G3B210_CANTC|nr:uncharacterized protein CANTEDRAFT_120237 [Yamadazyma tenuis ATCC 10573]EGV64578.1 hypothetical protein CANTEDRAFT_120237 [Yamadazyma tenuis ATCC 10573]WEJ97345.1 asparagine-linked glycosylation protein [Yamadazyma tenuis]
MLVFLFCAVVVIASFFKVLSTVLPRLFLVPTQLWQDKIEHVMNYPKPIYLRVGMKRSSFRRRLVTASAHPSYYNNFNNNKLKIHPEDCENKDNFFVDGMKRRAIEDPGRKVLFGFFHPYANNGGGGERVLWQAVHSTLLTKDTNIAVIYTVNMEEPANILRKVQDKFGIDVDGDRVVFIYLRKYGKLIANDYWKHFTLLGQLFGSLMLSAEALFELSPDVWVDTIGLPGSYFLVSVSLKIPILAYVHYPILQQDMFNKLKYRNIKQLIKFRPSVQNIKDVVKLVYWDALYYLYVYLGSLVDITVANGSWTFDHMQKIWFLNKKYNSSMEVLFPPCGTENGHLEKALVSKRNNKMIYIAQFRSEKRHDLILKQYSEFLKVFQKSKQPIKNLPTLVFLGSCRTGDDTETLLEIKQLTAELNLSDYVEFIVDCSYSEILHQLSKVKFGLNSMWNEHFGIGVVEYMNHGVIPIVHASAGPLLDISLNKSREASNSWKSDSGFFFKSATDPDFDPAIQSESKFTFTDEYSYPKLTFKEKDQLIEYPELSVLLMKLFIFEPEFASQKQLASMRQTGFDLVLSRFSNKTFNVTWMKYTRDLLTLEKKFRDTKREGIEEVH